MLAYIVLILIVFMVAAWILFCNARTLNQRTEIIKWVYSDSQNWMNGHSRFEDVTYDRHLWHLVTFRNPKRLYDFTNCP